MAETETETAAETETQTPSPVGYVADAAAIAQVIRDLIESARSSIVLQMYMFAGNGETEMLRRREGAFPYAHTVARWLIERRARSPELAIAVVLDTQTIDDARHTRNGPGAKLTRELLAEAGIPVLHANLFGTQFDARRRFPPGAQLHDGRWRDVPAEAFGRAQQRWQTWHNVEDHRKNLVIDEGAWGAVTSHNFLDVAADWHENLFVVGPPAAGALWSQARAALAAALELPQRLSAEPRARVAALAARPAAAATTAAAAAAAAAAARLPRAPVAPELRALGDPAAIPEPRPGNVSVLATSEIRPHLIAALAAAEPGDQIRAASTWFSDRELLDAFVAAAERGADVQLLTDDLHGLPLGAFPSWFVRRLANLRVIDRARGICRAGFELRIHPSASGRMMHLKTAAFLGRRGRALIGGQANYTPNSFSGAWLETGLAITGADHVIDAFLAQFAQLWRAAAPPRPAAPLAGAAHRALLSLVEKTVFRF
ncbi:MAG TPA: phospholipase D-like domain-containing protein [Kofleriaceae bacterium]|nr:phospholipase D-like domain-containing protein [Kofleriaceae bacterium]